MTKEEAKEWLEGSVNDLFMNYLYYDRKNCEEMGVRELRSLMDKGIINKEMMIKVFTKNIENQFNN